MSASPEFCIVNAPGINCNDETAQALTLAGASVEQIHISDLKRGDKELSRYKGLVIAGGFSYGDIIRAGAIFANEFTARRQIVVLDEPSITEQLNEFTSAKKPMLGICNGFQVLVEAGILPGGKIDPSAEHIFTLDTNQNLKFECRWSRLRVEDSNCQFIDEEDIGRVIAMPIAHAEGRFLSSDPEAYRRLIRAGQAVLRYCDIDGVPTEQYPDNPNGSPLGINAICSPDGTALGMMPHDERTARRELYPNWRREEVIMPQDFYSKILKNAVKYAKEM